MEVQLTDYENAAFSVFIVLLTRAIMSLGLNFYLPISKVSLPSAAIYRSKLPRWTDGSDFPIQVDENMHRAHRRDAINTQKFYFRKNLFDPKPGHPCDPSLDALSSSLPTVGEDISPPRQPRSPDVPNGFGGGGGSHAREPSRCESSCSSHRPSRVPSPDLSESSVPTGPVEDEYDEFTINEIVNGAPDRNFPGLIGVVRIYLDGLEKEGKVSEEVRKGIDRSLELVRRRADGEFFHFTSLHT